MATYVKGNPVANATSYELYKNVGGTYTKLQTASTINFEVSALGLAAGDHVLVVKAKASGYTDSEYSNAVTYVVSGGSSGGDPGVELDPVSGTSTFAVSSIPPNTTWVKNLTPGATYNYSITTDYTGTLTLYPADTTLSKNGMTAIMSVSVTSGTPITGTFTMPLAVGYYGASSAWNPDAVAFRSQTSNTVNINYTFTPTGAVDTDPLEGSMTYTHSGVSVGQQRVFGFESGATYRYNLVSDYEGSISFYWGYSDASAAAGSVETLSAESLPVTSGTPVTGTLTVPTTAGTTYTSRTPDTLILRSSKSTSVTIQYEFVKQ